MYYDALNIKNITNKQFWKTTKTFLSEKSKTSSRITWENKDKTISNDATVAKEFSLFFKMQLNP